MPLQVIHINQRILKKNVLSGAREPAITYKRKYNGRASYAHQLSIRDENDNEVARVVVGLDKPLDCGARCWIETSLRLVPLDLEGKCLTPPSGETQSSS